MMSDIRSLVERVAGAFGPDADAANVEAVAASLLESSPSNRPFTGVRLHVGLNDCSSLLVKTVRARAYDKIRRIGSHLDGVLRETGMNGARRISATSLTDVAGRATATDIVMLAGMLEDAARDCGASSVTALSADVARSINPVSGALLSAIPEVLSATTRVTIAVHAASAREGVHIDAVTAAMASIRSYAGAPEGLQRVWIVSGDADDPPEADASVHFTAEAAPLIAEAFRSAPHASVDDLCDILIATGFALGRRGAQDGEQAASIMRARSGLDVRFGGVDVDPGHASPLDRPVHAACAAAIAYGFRAAVRGSRLVPETVVIPPSAARVLEILSESDRDVQVQLSTSSPPESGDDEPDWIRRGGHIRNRW